MAQHSHSRQPSLHWPLVEHTGLLVVGSKHPVALVECTGSVEVGSRRQGRSVGLIDRAAYIVLDHNPETAHTLPEEAEGSYWWMGSTFLAAGDSQRPEPQLLLVEAGENMAAAVPDTDHALAHRMSQGHARLHILHEFSLERPLFP